MYLSLEKRCQDILQRIIFAGGYMKIQDLADEMQVSRRSVYYDLNKINEWLSEQGIEPFIAERNKGIFATPEQVHAILQVFGELKNMASYVFTPKERCYWIICSIIIRDKPMYIEQFMELCQVSRNTIINDLKSVTSFLALYALTLSYDIKEGYWIDGDSIKKRAVFFMLFSSLWEYEKHNKNHLGNSEKFCEIIEKLHMIEKELNVEYAEGTLPSLAMFLTTVDKHHEYLDFQDMDQEEIQSTKEYILADSYFPDLDINEKIYVTLHLLGSRLQTIPINVMNKQGKTYEYASALVKEFEKVSCIYFTRREELIQAINAHLKTSLYRYRYGIQLGNPLLKSIQNEYAELFELTQKSCEVLEEGLGCLISDAEVAYLTLHFGAFLNAGQSKGNQNTLRIAIICPNGIGTGNMLRSEVSSLVPQATEIRNIPLSQYNEDHSYDVVISTVVLPKEKRLIVVHPILTDQDRVTILRHCMYSETVKNVDVQEIVRLASQYMPVDRLEDFQKDLNDYYSGVQIHKVPHRNFGRELTHYLNKGHIMICREECDWKEAITMSCKPLLDDRSIDQNYIDSILYDQMHRGLSMFLADEIVLAHSAIENGVHKLDVAMTLFRYPVTFLNGQKARIIIALCAEDQTKHIRILKDVLNIFSKKKNIDHLISLQTTKEVYEYLKSYTFTEEN